MISNEVKAPAALLISVYKETADQLICEEHLEELELLCETYGLKVLKKIPCHSKKFVAATYITSGKLEEIVEEAQKIRAELIVFDDEISPGQQRNLEKIFGIPVIDRTEVILGVFEQRAQTKEARLQVELAEVKYQAPRLKRMWTHLSRQAGTVGGGGAYLKGKGEKQIELDRRQLKDKIHQLQKEIDEVSAYRETQRNARARTGIPTFAIIGYTNAGKSTLLNALTDAGVFVENKLFATLDTTTRKYTLRNNQEILLIDTVGFIRKLPHQLVAAFKSTLEEATQADILIHVIDSSHPMAEEQAAASFEVLKELGASKKPIITLLNKIDRNQNGVILNKLRMSYPKTVRVSALNHTGFDDLQEAMIEELAAQRKTLHLIIPQSDYSLVSAVIREGNVLSKEYEHNDVILKVDLPPHLVRKVEKYKVEE